MQLQEGDILLVDTEDGANVNISNGILQMTGGFDTAVYLSIYGHDDSQLWMNGIFIDSEKIKCQFVPYCKGSPLTPATLRKSEQLLYTDLEWFKKDGICTKIEINSSQIDRNTTNFSVRLLTDSGVIWQNVFAINWNYQAGTNGN